MSNSKFDWTSFTDLVSSIDWFKHSIVKSNDFDAYKNKTPAGQFKATVLTNLMGITETATSTGKEGDAAAVGRYIFKAYIDPKVNATSPHAFIKNPCDLAEAGDSQGALNNTMLCTTFEVVGDPNSADFPVITPGVIVEVQMYGGDFSCDYQNGKFLKVIHGQAPSSTATISAAMCDSIKDAFGGLPDFAGGAGAGPWEADYNGIKGTHVVKNGMFPDELLVRVDTAYSEQAFKMLVDAVPSYNRLAQAYLAKFGKKLPINGGFRCYSGGKYCQVETKQKKGKLAATPGTSLHGWGIAFDWGAGGFNTERYKWMFKNAPSYGWVNPLWARDGKGIEEAWHFEFVGDPSGNPNPIKNKRKPSKKPPAVSTATETTGTEDATT